MTIGLVSGSPIWHINRPKNCRKFSALKKMCIVATAGFDFFSLGLH